MMRPDLREWVDRYESQDPSAWITEVDPAEGERIARMRCHTPFDASQHFLADRLQSDRIGALGELAFEKRFGLRMRRAHGGDGGVDFRAQFHREITIDIKTREDVPTRYLMVPTDEIYKGSAEWLVMAQLLDDCHVQFLGWDHKSALTLEKPGTVGRHTRETYARPIHQLRPMYQLEYLLNLRIRDE
jgi:hypothetical protein